MVGLGILELLFVVFGLVLTLAPLALAIWALVTASGLRRQVDALEQRVTQLESPRPPAS